MAKKAEEWIGRVAWMNRMNGQVEVDRGRMMWKLLTRPSMEYAKCGGQEDVVRAESWSRHR